MPQSCLTQDAAYREILRGILARHGIAQPRPDADGLESVSVFLPGDGAGILAIHIGARRVWILAKPPRGGERLVYSGPVHDDGGIETFLKDAGVGQ